MLAARSRKEPQTSGIGDKALADTLGNVTGLGPQVGSIFGSTLRATAEDPGQVAKSSLRSGKESIAGIPAGVKMLVEDPEQAIKSIAEEIGRLERADREPRLSTIVRLARALKVQPAELLSRVS